MTIADSARTGAELLCELHAHTTWSDGAIDLDTVVDAYGQAGFDVLCLTDHVVRDGSMIGERVAPRYFAAVAAAGRRARDRYDMLVIPGLELTWDDPDDAAAAHAVVLGVEEFIGLGDGLEPALERARDLGAAIIAAHPHALHEDDIPGRTTRRWWLDAGLRSLAHRFELINRRQVFAWVAERDMPAVASGDFHRPEHLTTWKTVLRCERDTGAIVEQLRSREPAMIVRSPVEALPQAFRQAA
jgi:predicted metal-dependent phosphoesterase TrpH